METGGSYGIIVNPEAGAKDRGQNIELIKGMLDGKNTPYKIHYTKGPLHAEELAKDISGHGRLIIAMGGDGTISEVINGICAAGADTTLGILPTGSGNDTIKSLGMERDLKKCMEQILRGRTEKIDIGKCNDRYFVNIMGMGFDGAVMENMEKMREGSRKKKKNRKPPYNRALLRTIFHYRSIPLKMWIDGKSFSQRFFMVCIANGTTFGGDFIIAPEACLTDGQFRVVCIDDISILKFFLYIRNVKKGIVIKKPEVTYLRGKNIKIISENTLYAQMDGECYINNIFNISILEKHLKVFVP